MDESTFKAQDGALETPEDAGKGGEGIVKRWLMELDLADKLEKDWRKDAQKAKDIYRNKNKKKNTFNILWANVEVLRPNLYNSTPKPDVRRRYRDADAIGKIAAEVLERTLAFETDFGEFDDVMKDSVFDLVLAGRGLARVCLDTSYDEVEADAMDNDYKGDDSSKEFDYQPPLPPMAPQQPIQSGQSALPPQQPPAPPAIQKLLASSKVYVELVQWQRFRRGPGNTWSDVPWIAYQHVITKDEVEKKFKGFGNKVNYDFVVDGANAEKLELDPTIFKRVSVWEILNKEDRNTIWIAPSYAEAPLLIEDDKLKLTGFFDCPEPLYAIDDASSLVPVCEYIQYKEQAEELNKITTRINVLVDGLKIRGIYDATVTEMGNIAAASDNEFIPSDTSTIAMQAGGMDKAIWMMPIEEIAIVLKELYVQRDQTKSIIYEIVGISDIMRGQSNPDETLGAQQLKSNNTSVRLQRRQREVQRFARDLMRIMGEIIAEHYSPEFLSAISGIQVTPQVMDVLRRDLVRGIHIDIETDSTIAADLAQDRKDVTEMMQGVGMFIQNFGPAVQSGIISMEAAKSILLAIMRRARLGRSVEDAIEQSNAQPPPQAPDPEAAQRQADAQSKAAELQQKDKSDASINALKQQELQGLAQAKQAEIQLKVQELKGKQTLEQSKVALEAEKIQKESIIKAAELKQIKIEAQHDRELQLVMKKMEIESNERIAAAQIQANNTQHVQKLNVDKEVGLHKVETKEKLKTEKKKVEKPTNIQEKTSNNNNADNSKAFKELSSAIRDVGMAIVNKPAPTKKIAIQTDENGNIKGGVVSE